MPSTLAAAPPSFGRDLIGINGSTLDIAQDALIAVQPHPENDGQVINQGRGAGQSRAPAGSSIAGNVNEKKGHRNKRYRKKKYCFLLNCFYLLI